MPDLLAYQELSEREHCTLVRHGWLQEVEVLDFAMADPKRSASPGVWRREASPGALA